MVRIRNDKRHLDQVPSIVEVLHGRDGLQQQYSYSDYTPARRTFSLLEHSADSNVTDARGNTALRYVHCENTVAARPKIQLRMEKAGIFHPTLTSCKGSADERQPNFNL